MKNNRPYKNDYKNRINSTKSKKKSTSYNTNGQYKKKNDTNKKKSEKVPTNIRIDMNRINDSASLDTSFLEGRIVKSEKKEKKVKEKVLKERNEDLVKKILSLRKVFFTLGIICTVVLVVLFLVNTFNTYSEKWFNSDSKFSSKKKADSKKIVDDNYLFLGSFHTDRFDFNGFDLDYHYVKVAKSDMKTDDILGNMKENVYDYNPSIVFIELGLSDINSGMSDDEVISNISKIVDGVLKNRPYAKIYIESFYPINSDVDNYNDDILSSDIDNSRIIKLNDLVKKLVASKEINYLDVYSMLEKNGVLNKEFTNNGIYLNKAGYQQVLKVIKKVIG